MAKRPKAETGPSEGEGAATPSLSAVEHLTTLIRVTKSGVHDGLGNVWQSGDIAPLPKDIAALFIAKELGVPADDASLIEAKKKAAETLEAQRLAGIKGGAAARQRSYDSAPQAIRDLAKEHGDEILSRWEMGEEAADILKDYTS